MEYKCKHCFDGYSAPMNHAADYYDVSKRSVCLSTTDGILWMDIHPSDHYDSWTERISFCPWCGRKIAPKEK